jgi:hypothetical protein
LSDLAPALIDGKRTTGPLEEEEGHLVFHACWELGPELYVIVVNTSEGAEDVLISLPRRDYESCKPMFGRKDRLEIDGNRLTGSIGYEEVLVYKCRK